MAMVVLPPLFCTKYASLHLMNMVFAFQAMALLYCITIFTHRIHPQMSIILVLRFLVPVRNVETALLVHAHHTVPLRLLLRNTA